ncbi:MAG: toll/interleukin-1 receptor domain-containing protein [Chlorobium sp.]
METVELLAFLSYQTADKTAASQVKAVLSGVGISVFLAHEDISVSEEWRLKILDEIGRASIFVGLLSKNYFQSPWCVQESGIAAYRSDMTVIPLSLDGAIPQGFISNFQSVKVDPERITIHDLIPGFLKHDFTVGIGLIIELICRSRSYRSAEANFQLLLPHVPKMTDEQIRVLLERVAENDQVHYASLCAREYLPPLLNTHGHLLKPTTCSLLKKVCADSS